MKKSFLTIIFAIFVAVLVACGGADKEGANGTGDTTDEVTTLKVGASPVPHAEILEEAKPLLEEQGIELEIVEFTDYVLPNKTLAEEELDANYFQHEPYLEGQIADNGYKFVNAGGIHIEPIGVYSKRHKSLDDLPEGAKIIMSNSVADHGRMLSMLEEKGLITIKEGVEKTAATIEDIDQNPKKLVFEADIEAPMVAKAYKNDEADAFLINGNFALDEGLNPAEDAIALESPENNPYVNLIVVREGDEEREEIKALVDALRSEKVQEFIKTKYQGSVISAAQSK
ncbi:MetQ/NlpA family ABC transporter substrate-binding protein [Metabacillus rhizolycopersici]|uniref:Lipoprotein n=1 Tax=Metabacillus rhizolycopersici TaxID=2875709 RepID=A0ABS7UQF9_9BACI|nr:MetQ/NlpA family ABC transporter substrate-binding protein [Metabacillus rhizolycopersici]MBZ5750287.1 MetQ/NlpA family ABC transporter substrate-binding protein [Metabacillus rhizolycopersici]